VLRESCAKIHAQMPVQFMIAAAAGWSDFLRRGWPNDVSVRVGKGQTYGALAHADASIVASGTATVEAALLDAPMVVVYRVSPLTAVLAKPLVRTSHFGMVNLIAGREIVPELIQKDFTSDRVATHILHLLRDPTAATAMRGELAEVRRRLGPPGAVERAADAITALFATPSGNAS